MGLVFFVLCHSASLHLCVSFSTSCAPATLENQLQPDLNLPGRGRSTGDESRRGADAAISKHSRIRWAEVRVVGDVEEFHPELLAGPLGHGQILKHGEIQV